MRFYYGYEEPRQKALTINEWYAAKRNPPEDFEDEILRRWNELAYIQKHPFPLKTFTVLVENK